MKLGIITIHSSHLIVSQRTPVLAGRSSLEVFWPAGCEAIWKPAELAAFLRASSRSRPPGSAVSVRALLRPWAPPAPALASSRADTATAPGVMHGAVRGAWTFAPVPSHHHGVQASRWASRGQQLGGAVLGWQCSPLAQRCRWASSPFPPLHCSWSAGSSVESLLVFI